MFFPLSIFGDIHRFFAQQLAAFAPYETEPHLAVAVSGGSDSMALCLLTHAFTLSHGGRVTALTVDHQLRPESAQEARQVAAWLAERGILHHTLRWEHSPLHSNLQHRAREARYRLMSDWCRQAGVLHLLLGHQEADVAEGFLMRALRGSGIQGIAAPAALQYRFGVRLIRPLLSFPREALRAWLTEIGQDWIDDPSNDNPRFHRNEIRKTLLHLNDQGSQKMQATSRLANAATHTAHAQQALEALSRPTLVSHLRFSPLGSATMDLAALLALPESVGQSTLETLLQMIGGTGRSTRFSSLQPLYARLHAMVHGREKPARMTLSGCFVEVKQRKARGTIPTLLQTDWQAPLEGAQRSPEAKKQYIMMVSKEPSTCPAHTDWPETEATLHWDHRFLLQRDGAAPLLSQVTITPLGIFGLKRLVAQDPTLAGQLHRWKTVPKSVLFSLPVVQALDSLPILPHIISADNCSKRMRVRFAPVRPFTTTRKFSQR